MKEVCLAILNERFRRGQSSSWYGNIPKKIPGILSMHDAKEREIPIAHFVTLGKQQCARQNTKCGIFLMPMAWAALCMLYAMTCCRPREQWVHLVYRCLTGVFGGLVVALYEKELFLYWFSVM